MKFVQFCVLQLLLTALSSAVDLECEFKMQKFHDHPEMYTCVAVDLETSEDDNYILKITDEHLGNNTNEDVKQFVAFDQTVEYFPSGLGTHFRNLEAINIKNSSLKYLFSSDLLGLTALKFFAVTNNNIVTVGPNLFDDNMNMVEIHFEGNKIKSISDDLLDPFENPKVVHFYNNECIKEDLKDPEASASDIKKMISEKCPLKPETLTEITKQQFQKLTLQLKTLEDAYANEQSKQGAKSEDPSSDEDRSDTLKLEEKIAELEYDKNFFETNVDLMNQTLNENAFEIKNLTDENLSLKLSNEIFQTNLTSTMESLTVTRVNLDNSKAETKSLSAKLDKEKLTTKTLNKEKTWLKKEVTKAKTAIKALENKLKKTIKDKDTEISNLKNDQKKLSEKIKNLEATSKKRIVLLESLNKELNIKNSRDQAKLAYYERLEKRLQKMEALQNEIQ